MPKRADGTIYCCDKNFFHYQFQDVNLCKDCFQKDVIIKPKLINGQIKSTLIINGIEIE